MAGMATRVQGVKTESASLPEAKAAPADDASPLDAAQLAEAFALFSRASEELSTAYNALQAQVGQLTERLSVLMGALPAGFAGLPRERRCCGNGKPKAGRNFYFFLCHDYGGNCFFSAFL